MPGANSTEVSSRDYPALPPSGWGEFWRWLWRSRRRVEVVGNSMAPTLKPGDQVFWDPRAYILTLPQVGDIVIAQDPRNLDRPLVKRIMAIAPRDNGEFAVILLGDNPDGSTDSRHFGDVRTDRILGKVTSRLP